MNEKRLNDTVIQYNKALEKINLNEADCYFSLKNIVARFFREMDKIKSKDVIITYIKSYNISTIYKLDDESVNDEVEKKTYAFGCLLVFITQKYGIKFTFDNLLPNRLVYKQYSKWNLLNWLRRLFNKLAWLEIGLNPDSEQDKNFLCTVKRLNEYCLVNKSSLLLDKALLLDVIPIIKELVEQNKKLDQKFKLLLSKMMIRDEQANREIEKEPLISSEIPLTEKKDGQVNRDLEKELSISLEVPSTKRENDKQSPPLSIFSSPSPSPSPPPPPPPPPLMSGSFDVLEETKKLRIEILKTEEKEIKKPEISFDSSDITTTNIIAARGKLKPPSERKVSEKFRQQEEKSSGDIAALMKKTVEKIRPAVAASSDDESSTGSRCSSQIWSDEEGESRARKQHTNTGIYLEEQGQMVDDSSLLVSAKQHEDQKLSQGEKPPIKPKPVLYTDSLNQGFFGQNDKGGSNFSDTDSGHYSDCRSESSRVSLA